MSKGLLIQELCQICDSILEISDKNNEKLLHLQSRYESPQIQQFQLLSSEVYSDSSIASLRRFDMDSLRQFHVEAMEHIDQVMNEEAKLEQLQTKLSNSKQNVKKQIKVPLKLQTNLQKTKPESPVPKKQHHDPTPPVRESWNFLVTKNRPREQTIEDRLDSINKTLSQFKSSMKIEMAKAALKCEKLQDHQLEPKTILEEKYNQQILLNESLQQELEKKRQVHPESHIVLADNSDCSLLLVYKFRDSSDRVALKDLLLSVVAELEQKEAKSGKFNLSEERMLKIEELERKIVEIEAEKNKSQAARQVLSALLNGI